MNQQRNELLQALRSIVQVLDGSQPIDPVGALCIAQHALRSETCPACNGSGRDPEGEYYEGSASSRCPRCNGTGITTHPIDTGHKLYRVDELKRCEACNGEGTIVPNDCEGYTDENGKQVACPYCES